jgi:hypothetical protein
VTPTVSIAEFSVFLLQWLVVVFSIFAGLFWLNAASTARRTEILYWPPWRAPRLVPQTDDPAALRGYQAKWNARAAICASIAAIAQAVLFVIDKYPTFS